MLWMQNDEKAYQRICLLGNTYAIRVQPLAWPQSHQPFESVAVALDNILCQSPLLLQQNRGLPWVLGRTLRRMLFWLHPISHSHSSHLSPPGVLLIHVNLFRSFTTSSLPASSVFYEQQTLFPSLSSWGLRDEFLFWAKKKKLIGMYLFFTSTVILNV